MAWTDRSLGAFLYLVVFGSMVGFSAYVYALDHLAVPIVSLYAYINPVVAAWLGWLIYDEPFGRREIAALGVILLGVVLVQRRPAAAEGKRSPQPEQNGTASV